MEPEQKAPVFGQIYRDYLRKLRRLDLLKIAESMGLDMEGEAILVPFLGQVYKISSMGITDSYGNEPSHSVKVVLSQYLLHAPSVLPGQKEWVSYKDFKDASPFVGGFHNNTEKAIANHFAGRLQALRSACLRLGGKDSGSDWGYQLSIRFDPLPYVPVLLLFNDVDEEFPAQCFLLFQREANRYLDMESIAILAWLLTDHLSPSEGDQRTKVM